MFNRALKDEIDRLCKQQGKVSSEIEEISKTFGALLVSLNKTLGAIAKRNEETVSWAKEFHRSMMEKFAQGLHSKIYAFVYLNRQTGKVRLLQVPSNEFEEAHSMVKQLISSEDSVDHWSMEGYTSTIVPTTGSDNVYNEVEKKFDFERPKDSYINNLMLARDKFAITKAQKNAINTIIENVKKLDSVHTEDNGK